MNNLSWLLYLAGVCGSLNVALWLLVGAAIFGAIVGIMLLCASTEQYDDENKTNFKRWGKKLLKSGVGVFIAVIVVGVVVPSKNTVYAIAASEMGEEVLNSPTATKAVKALDAWLDKQITEGGQSITPAKDEEQ